MRGFLEGIRNTWKDQNYCEGRTKGSFYGMQVGEEESFRIAVVVSKQMRNKFEFTYRLSEKYLTQNNEIRNIYIRHISGGTC